jgi:hypothetical protein
MWSPSRIDAHRSPRVVGAVLIAASVLAGCSDIYFDRRETVALGADDHKATDEIEQMIDPWPSYVGKRRIAFDGNRMQSAVERYRTGREYPPINATTSSVAYQQAAQAAAATASATNQSQGMSAPAAPVK